MSHQTKVKLEASFKIFVDNQDYKMYWTKLTPKYLNVYNKDAKQPKKQLRIYFGIHHAKEKKHKEKRSQSFYCCEIFIQIRSSYKNDWRDDKYEVNDLELTSRDYFCTWIFSFSYSGSLTSLDCYFVSVRSGSLVLLLFTVAAVHLYFKSCLWPVNRCQRYR